MLQQVAEVVLIERTNFEPATNFFGKELSGLGVTFHLRIVHGEEVTSKRCVELGEEVPNTQGHILEDGLGGNLSVVQQQLKADEEAVVHLVVTDVFGQCFRLAVDLFGT